MGTSIQPRMSSPALMVISADVVFKLSVVLDLQLQVVGSTLLLSRSVRTAVPMLSFGSFVLFLCAALPPRRRPIPALPASPRQYVPAVAEAKCPPSLSVVVSPAVNKQREDPWRCRADGAGADTAGAITPGAVTPGALRARSVSAPMIWD